MKSQRKTLKNPDKQKIFMKAENTKRIKNNEKPRNTETYGK